MTTDWKPSRYHVYCSVPSNDKRNETGIYTFRVGVTNDRDAIAGMIADDRKSSTDTFGGLLEKPKLVRTYSAFEAEWSKLDI